MAKLKQQIADQLEALRVIKLPPAMRKSNTARYLHDIYIWQEVKRYSTEKEKAAWTAAQKNGGPIHSDDELRTYGKGEHIECESNTMSCMVRLTAAVKRFDQEKFIEAVSKKYDIPLEKLTALAEATKVEGKPSLSKFVVEA